MPENSQINGGECRRVLTLDPAGLLWGSERAMLDFISELPGFEAACCCPPETPLIAKLEKIGVQAFPTFQSNLHLRGYAARLEALCGLLRAIIKFRPDVLHVNQAGATRIALVACRIMRVPCVVHVRLREDVEYLAKLKPSPKVLNSLIAISPPIEALIAAQPELAAIPCRMSVDAYRLESDNVEHPNTPEKRWDLVCVGRFSESKGQELLIRALKNIQSGDFAPRLAFVGQINDYAKELQCLVQELGMKSRVDFLGHSDTVGSILQQSRWLVCPSDYEPLGRVLFEAWDYGIPVIVGRQSGGAAASVKASGGGLMFDEWAAESIEQTLSQAIAHDDSARTNYAVSGRSWLEQTTNPQTYSVAMAEVLQGAIESKRSTS